MTAKGQNNPPVVQQGLVFVQSPIQQTTVFLVVSSVRTAWIWNGWWERVVRHVVSYRVLSCVAEKQRDDITAADAA